MTGMRPKLAILCLALLGWSFATGLLSVKVEVANGPERTASRSHRLFSDVFLNVRSFGHPFLSLCAGFRIAVRKASRAMASTGRGHCRSAVFTAHDTCPMLCILVPRPSDHSSEMIQMDLELRNLGGDPLTTERGQVDGVTHVSPLPNRTTEQVKQLSEEELGKATEGFSRRLGSGFNGTVYGNSHCGEEN